MKGFKQVQGKDHNEVLVGSYHSTKQAIVALAPTVIYLIPCEARKRRKRQAVFLFITQNRFHSVAWRFLIADALECPLFQPFAGRCIFFPSHSRSWPGPYSTPRLFSFRLSRSVVSSTYSLRLPDQPFMSDLLFPRDALRFCRSTWRPGRRFSRLCSVLSTL